MGVHRALAYRLQPAQQEGHFVENDFGGAEHFGSLLMLLTTTRLTSFAGRGDVSRSRFRPRWRSLTVRFAWRRPRRSHLGCGLRGNRLGPVVGWLQWLLRHPFGLFPRLLFGTCDRLGARSLSLLFLGGMSSCLLLRPRELLTLLLLPSLPFGLLDFLQPGALCRLFVFGARGGFGSQAFGSSCRFGANPFDLACFGANLLGTGGRVGPDALDMFSFELTLGFGLALDPLPLGAHLLLGSSQLGPLALGRLMQSLPRRLLLLLRTRGGFSPQPLSFLRPSPLGLVLPSPLGLLASNPFGFLGSNPLGPRLLLGALPLLPLALATDLFLDPGLLGPSCRGRTNLLDSSRGRCLGGLGSDLRRIGSCGLRRPLRLPPGTTGAFGFLLQRALSTRRSRSPDLLNVAALVGYLSFDVLGWRATVSPRRARRGSGARVVFLGLSLKLARRPCRCGRPDSLELESVIGRIWLRTLVILASLRGALSGLGPDPLHSLGQALGGRAHLGEPASGRLPLGSGVRLGVRVGLLVFLGRGSKHPRHDATGIAADRQLRRNPIRLIKLETGGRRVILIRISIGCDSHGCS